MDNALILSHLDAGVLTLTLNRPDRLNSFNDEMHRQLSEALTQAERDDSVRCLLIAGAGRGFCAGQDLNDRNVSADQQAPDLGLSVERFYNPLIRRLTALPKPVVCAVNGVAAGAGAALAWRAISSSPPTTPALFSRSAVWGWCLIPAAVGSCRGWPATPARWAWPCWVTKSALNRRWSGA